MQGAGGRLAQALDEVTLAAELVARHQGDARAGFERECCVFQRIVAAADDQHMLAGQIGQAGEAMRAVTQAPRVALGEAGQADEDFAARESGCRWPARRPRLLGFLRRRSASFSSSVGATDGMVPPVPVISTRLSIIEP